MNMHKSKFVGSNILRVKKHNMRAILLTFLHSSSISRSELAKQTNLSNTTITNLTAELLEQGIIREKSTPPTEDIQPPRSVGRPQRMLQLVPNARYVVGVHVGIGMFRVAITNLHAELICNKMMSYPVDRSAFEVLDDIANLVQETIAESNVAPQRILGVGVGASGLVNHVTGINLRAASLGWNDVPIREYLEAQLNLPVCVDNNVRAMALGEAYFGLGRGVDVLTFIYGRIGVGAGIVVNGQVFRGSGVGAGEIGHTIMLPHDGDLCRCGQHGCLETLVSEPKLLREAQLIADENKNGILAINLRNAELNPIEAVFTAARDGDQPTLSMIEKQMHYLGLSLANLVNVLNPELIILGGMFAQGSDLILPRVEATMRRLAFAGLGENVNVQPTSFGWRAGVVGAASLALKEFFYEAARDVAMSS